MKNITVIVLTFHTPENIILDCLSSIDKDIRVLIVENSKTFSHKDKVLSKFNNVDILCTGENLGYGGGNNFAINEIKTDYILGFFGLIMQLGPIANWGLNLNKKTIEVDTEKFETNQKGIYAIGDICTYPGKLKLILSGFHEGALAARACFKLARPNEKYRFEFTTSSKAIKDRLGVKSD